MRRAATPTLGPQADSSVLPHSSVSNSIGRVLGRFPTSPALGPSSAHTGSQPGSYASANDSFLHQVHAGPASLDESLSIAAQAAQLKVAQCKMYEAMYALVAEKSALQRDQEAVAAERAALEEQTKSVSARSRALEVSESDHARVMSAFHTLQASSLERERVLSEEIATLQEALNAATAKNKTAVQELSELETRHLAKSSQEAELSRALEHQRRAAADLARTLQDTEARMRLLDTQHQQLNDSQQVLEQRVQEREAALEEASRRVLSLEASLLTCERNMRQEQAAAAARQAELRAELQTERTRSEEAAAAASAHQREMEEAVARLEREREEAEDARRANDTKALALQVCSVMLLMLMLIACVAFLCVL